MLISVQGSLAGGADPGAGGPAAGTFLPDRPPPRKGQEVPAGSGGPGRDQGRSLRAGSVRGAAGAATHGVPPLPRGN